MVTWVIRHGVVIVEVFVLAVVAVVVVARGVFIYHGDADAKWRQDQMFWHAVAALVVPAVLALAIAWVSPGA